MAAQDLIAPWIAVVIAGLYGVDRLACWMEARGWIYWRKKRGNTGTLSAGVLEVQALFEPSQRYVIEARSDDEEAENDDAGDPPEARGSDGKGVREAAPNRQPSREEWKKRWG